MKPTIAFFDTNVLLYLLSDDVRKADRVEALLSEGNAHISVQVLNEMSNVTHRKLKMPWDDITEFLSPLRAVCEVHPLTVEIHDSMRAIAQRYKISVYDAALVASALSERATVLYSEDMQHGMVFEKTLRVVNPFSK